MATEQPRQGEKVSRKLLEQESRGGRGETGKQPRSRHSITKERRSVMIYEILAKGEQNATTGKVICEKLDLSIRELQAGIRRERKAGRAICASTGNSGKAGYFIPANQGEMRRYCNSLTHRAGEIFATRKACLDLMDTLPAEAED